MSDGDERKDPRAFEGRFTWDDVEEAANRARAEERALTSRAGRRSVEPETSASATEYRSTSYLNIAIALGTAGFASVLAYMGETDAAVTAFGLGLATAGGVQSVYTGSRAYTKGKAGVVR